MKAQPVLLLVIEMAKNLTTAHRVHRENFLAPDGKLMTSAGAQWNGAHPRALRQLQRRRKGTGIDAILRKALQPLHAHPLQFGSTASCRVSWTRKATPATHISHISALRQ